MLSQTCPPPPSGTHMSPPPNSHSHAHLHAYIHTYWHAYAYTHIHTHTHTLTHAEPVFRHQASGHRRQQGRRWKAICTKGRRGRLCHTASAAQEVVKLHAANAWPPKGDCLDVLDCVCLCVCVCVEARTLISGIRVRVGCVCVFTCLFEKTEAVFILCPDASYLLMCTYYSLLVNGSC